MENALGKPQVSRRRRHFKRDPSFRSERSRAGRLSLRKRDIDIVAAVARHRFMSSAQVIVEFCCACPSDERHHKEHRIGCSCTCGAGHHDTHRDDCPNLFQSEKHVVARLLELYQAGYLERPISQLQLRVRNGMVSEGSVPMVYSVTKAGIDLIGEERCVAIGRGKLSWATKVNEGTRIFMEHTLHIGDVSIGLDRALRGHFSLERLSDGALKEGMSEARRTSTRPFSVKGQYQKKKLTAVCDLAFGLVDRHTGRTKHVLTEVDLGHMPIDRARLNQTSIMRKVIAYATAFEAKRIQTEFGWKHVSVLILTTTPSRVFSCVKATKEFFGSDPIARIFLFGMLDASHNPLDYEFIDGRGNVVRLGDF